MVTGEIMHGKQGSLWKCDRPLTLPLSPQVHQSRHFSQNDGATGCSVATPGPGSAGNGAAGAGGGGSPGCDTVCVLGFVPGGSPRSGSGTVGCSGAVPAVGVM